MIVRKILNSLLLLGSIMILPNFLFAQIKSYQFQQIDDLQKNEKRSTVVFIHTDWCKYCKLMQQTTFKNKNIIKLLNEQFYFIDFNAEEKLSITFNAKTFKYKPTGSNTGIHELAEQLATVDSKISYPTLCFLNPNNEIIFQYNEFINVKNLIILLQQLK